MNGYQLLAAGIFAFRTGKDSSTIWGMARRTRTEKPATIALGAESLGTDGAANESAGAFADGPPLPQHNKVVLVLDLVESVRLMAQDESGVVARWHAFSKKASKMIPRHHGRVVKSLGDGMLCEFDHARHAVQAATALHQLIKPANQGRSESQKLYLRIGINATRLYLDDVDVYGTGVNLAARLATLAGPGETIASAGVRDQLTDGLDADLEDMGDCFLKHVPEPVRAYRIGPPGPRPVLQPAAEYNNLLKPAMAVIPFTARSNEPEHLAIGELIADGVNSQLSKTRSLRVIARLSASAFRGRAESSEAVISNALAVQYILRGSYTPLTRGRNAKLLVQAELADPTSGETLWTERIQGSVADLLNEESETCQRLAQACHLAVARFETEKVWRQPLETLESYSLQLSGIHLAHSSNAREFQRAADILQALATRHPRLADPYAWLGKWHVLKVIRGNSTTPAADAQSALKACDEALARFPGHSTAHAIRGYVLSQTSTERDQSRDALDFSINTAPNDVHGWLYRSVWGQHWGDTAEAVNDALFARKLSPLDPLGFFFDGVLSSAYAFNGQYQQAIETAQRCLRLDRNHIPAVRTILVSQVESGQLAAAQKTGERLRLLAPEFSLEAYRAIGNMESNARKRVYEALKVVGFR